MKRRGETLTEFLIAAAVFGVITTGIFEFIANQTENLADLRIKDDLMFYAQKYINTPEDKRPANNTAVNEDNGTTTYNLTNDTNGKILTVTRNSFPPMTFELEP